MDLVTHIKQAIMNLVSSKLRSFLAILGILVGTGSVVALITCGQLATSNALAQFKSLGTNLIAVNIQNQQSNSQSSVTRQFTLNDLPAFYRRFSQIDVIAPYLSSYQSINIGSLSTSAEIVGVTDAFLKVMKLPKLAGRYISTLDNTEHYCMVGSMLAKKIEKSGLNPLGQQIMVGKSVFTVVGVVGKFPENLFVYTDVDNGILIPLQSAPQLDKKLYISDMVIRFLPGTDMSMQKNKVVHYLSQLLPDDKLYPRDPQEIIKIYKKNKETYFILLASIGAISLIVGGIGVMNIMLVSVVERRRGIGVRMAIGAKRRDILRMFLIEAIMLTLLGGFLGILVGSSVSFAIAWFNHWEFTFYALPPLLGFGVSVVVGIISGYYPALRASRLDPIQILQS